jgi:SAM (Sterile alpha motif) domain-containing protein
LCVKINPRAPKRLDLGAAMDIEAWLRSLGLEEYEPAFRDNRIDAAILPKLTGEDLKEIGITAVGDRRKLLEAIAALREGAAPVTALALNRLAPRQRAEMIAGVTGGKALPEEVAAQIIDRTDGVPLFVEELAKAVVESGMLSDAGDRYTAAGPVPALWRSRRACRPRCWPGSTAWRRCARWRRSELRWAGSSRTS